MEFFFLINFFKLFVFLEFYNLGEIVSHQFSQMDNIEGGVFYLTVRNARISSYRVGILFTKVDVLKSFQVKRLSDVKKM